MEIEVKESTPVTSVIKHTQKLLDDAGLGKYVKRIGVE